ncbi:SdpI family protein [Bacteroidota bacterium]
MKKALIAAIIIIVLSFIIAIYSYSIMPNEMASHWNAKGEVDGYMSKFWGVFLMPIISVGILIIFLIIPYIDPLKKNIQEFRRYFDGLIVLLMMFLLYIYILTLLWNSGTKINIGQFMLPALGILFFYMGVLIQHAKMNWFVGIRTPWTLSNETVWNKTHKIGAKLFKACGVIAILAMLVPNQSIFIVLVSVLLVTAYVIIYSYVEYKRVKK